VKEINSILVTGGAGFIGSNLALELQDRYPSAKILIPEVIFHLASITDTTVTDQELMMRKNVDGFKNILEVAAESEATVVYASSASVYGNVKDQIPLSKGCRRKILQCVWSRGST